MFTMEPRTSRSAGRACLQVRHVAFRLTARLRSKASSVSSTAPASPRARLAPTLLWRMSRRPKRSRAAAIRRATSASRVTSAAKAHARPPSPWINSTVSWAEESARSTTHTCAPSRPSTMAVARPLPMVWPEVCPPPTTIAALPSTRLPMIAQGYCGRTSEAVGMAPPFYRAAGACARARGWALTARGDLGVQQLPELPQVLEVEVLELVLDQQLDRALHHDLLVDGFEQVAEPLALLPGVAVEVDLPALDQRHHDVTRHLRHTGPRHVASPGLAPRFRVIHGNRAYQAPGEPAMPKADQRTPASNSLSMARARP